MTGAAVTLKRERAACALSHHLAPAQSFTEKLARSSEILPSKVSGSWAKLPGNAYTSMVGVLSPKLQCID
jgi:hypothetical protein